MPALYRATYCCTWYGIRNSYTRHGIRDPRVTIYQIIVPVREPFGEPRVPPHLRRCFGYTNQTRDTEISKSDLYASIYQNKPTLTVLLQIPGIAFFCLCARHYCKHYGGEPALQRAPVLLLCHCKYLVPFLYIRMRQTLLQAL